MTRTSKNEIFVGELQTGVPLLRGMSAAKLQFRDNVLNMRPGQSFLTNISAATVRRIAASLRPTAKFSIVREGGKIRIHLLEEPEQSAEQPRDTP